MWSQNFRHFWGCGKIMYFIVNCFNQARSSFGNITEISSMNSHNIDWIWKKHRKSMKNVWICDRSISAQDADKFLRRKKWVHLGLQMIPFAWFRSATHTSVKFSTLFTGVQKSFNCGFEFLSGVCEIWAISGSWDDCGRMHNAGKDSERSPLSKKATK